jgi:hypothetical protein
VWSFQHLDVQMAHGKLEESKGGDGRGVIHVVRGTKSRIPFRDGMTVSMALCHTSQSVSKGRACCAHTRSERADLEVPRLNSLRKK